MKTFKEIVAHRLEVGFAANARYDEFIGDVMTDIAEELDRRLPIAEDDKRPDAPAPAMVDDPNRCQKCHWPLAASCHQGCVVGNCSFRGER